MTVVSTTVHAKPHGQIVAASVAVAFSLIERCVLMICPRPWYLARFGYNGIFWTSFAIFIDHQGLKNQAFLF